MGRPHVMRDILSPTLEARSVKPGSNQTRIAAFERSISVIDSPQFVSRRGKVTGVRNAFPIARPGGEHYKNAFRAGGKGGNQLDCMYRRNPRKEK